MGRLGIKMQHKLKMNTKKRMKKAQMAAFVLIGIVLLIGASALTYFMYISKKAPGDRYLAENLPETLDKLSLDTLMTSCIKKASPPQIIKIGKYGGTINPNVNNYRLYNHTFYRNICEQKPGYSKCVNSILTRGSMQEELQGKITSEMVACVVPAMEFYKNRGYDIQAGEVSTRVMIGTDDVNVIVTYPLLISRGASKISVSDYSVKFDYPLGKLYDLAMTIMNDESAKGYFNQEDWMYNHSVEILIQKHRPYPDIVYRLSKNDFQKKEFYIFNFALQGYDRLPELAGLGAIGTSGQMTASPIAAKSTAYDQDLGCCYSKNDGNCFESSDKGTCSDKSLEFRKGSCKQAGFSCKPLSEEKYDNRTGQCYGLNCFNCGSTYRSGDDPTKPSDFTGPSKKNGESWCEYDGPTGQGFDLVGSRHYKQLCVDGNVLVEDCKDYRGEVCAEETVKIDGKDMTRAVCRPNRWQDCHLFGNNQAECEDKGKRDCYWSTMQDHFAVGKPKDEEASPTTPYEERHCVPSVAPGLRFWNQIEGAQVCGWANNYYECAIPGCFQEWTDFDAVFCSQQGDCGISRNYIGKMPSMPANSLMQGASQLPFITPDSQILGTGFTSGQNIITKDLFETTLPSESEANGAITRTNIKKLPAYPKEWNQKDVTPEMFIHNSPNDYSLIGIMAFGNGMAGWAKNKIDNIYNDIWSYIVNGKDITWTTAGVSICNVWGPSATAIDCERCNNNPYRPCTEYGCRSLGMFCNYEEIDGVGKCSSYEASTIGKPIVKFDGQITPGYTLKTASLSSSEASYIGKEIKEPLTNDYTFQVATDRETQCMLTLIPGANFGLNPPFPGTTPKYAFSKKHNLTISYLSADSLSVMLLPLEVLTMVNLNTGQILATVQSTGNGMINYVKDIADDCDDCHNFPYLDCDNSALMFVSSDVCDQMHNTKDQMQTTFDSVNKILQDSKSKIDELMAVAEKNAIKEILNYAVTQHKYHAFIRCRDRGGNENEQDLDFIRFKVSPKELPNVETPDGPPTINAIMPENFSEQTAGSDGKKNVYVFLDQLSECAYSTSNKEFVYMENRFQCTKSTYAGGLGSGYACNMSIPFTDLTAIGTPLYIKCIDHPEHYETYNFRIEQGSAFTAPPNVVWIEPATDGDSGTVVIKDPRIMNSSKPVITVPTTSVKVFMELKRPENDHEKALECKYATAPAQLGASSTTFVDPKSGGTECSNCTALLTATGTDYYVSCHFKTDKRNEGDAVQYTLKTPSAPAS